jgi:hypothetical protein
MTSQDTLTVFASMKSAFPDAVVSVSVSLSGNEKVETTGLRNSPSYARQANGNGLKTGVDMAVIVPAEPFGDPMRLCGCEATITDKAGVVTSGRLLPARLHALGGYLVLSIGEYDRVLA